MGRRADALPALVFIHGMFAGSWIFERWLSFFGAGGWPSTAVDLRSDGVSAPVETLGRVTLRDYLENALRAVASFDRPIVIGHSMGALIAQAIAARGTIRGAVLVSPAPPRGIPLLNARLALRQLKFIPQLVRSRQIQVGRDDADAIIFNRTPPAERATLFDRLAPDSGRAGRDILLGALRVNARYVNCPVAVFSGDHDRFIPLHVARRVARKYGAPCHVLHGRGHLPMQEPGWQEAAQSIERWLQWIR